MNSSDRDPPVTVDILQQIKPGYEAAFEAVITDLIAAAKLFEGHLGANIFRSSDPANPEYRIVFKFDSLSHLQQWENSEIRHKLLQKARKFILGDVKWQILTGLETWFTLSTQGAIVPPPRYKMLAITFLAAYPTASLINFILPTINWLPSIIRPIIGTLALLSLMTYVVMPRMTKLFAWWLYPKS
jgi:antibiotic biosynthesis monooxygenase (ABM) superfamily enzyme